MIKFSESKMQDGYLCLKPLELSDKQQAAALCAESKDKIHYAEIKLYRPHRSLNANAYAWHLMNEIGNVLRKDKEDIYLDMLKSYGQGGTVSIQEKHCDSFRKTWKYQEEIGKSNLNGKMFHHFRFWVGSSEYDTHEMSIFIDGIVEEAKNLGIETMTPKELSLLKEAWVT